MTSTLFAIGGIANLVIVLAVMGWKSRKSPFDRFQSELTTAQDELEKLNTLVGKLQTNIRKLQDDVLILNSELGLALDENNRLRDAQGNN